MNTKQKDNRPLSEEEVLFIEKLIIENRKIIKNIIYNILGERYKHHAEDAVCDVYLLMCQKIDVLKNHNAPRAWIFVAARYVARGVVRNNKKHDNTIPIDMIEDFPSDINVEEEATYRIWLSDKVPEKLIKSLTKREQQVYQKLYIEGKTPKQAAVELNLTANAVYNFNKNIRDKIKYAVKRKMF